MSVGRINYPFPVLGNGDDITGAFEARVEFSAEEDNYVIDIAFSLEHPSLEKFVDTEDACFAIEIVCPSTFYRTVVRTGDTALSISIPAVNLRDRVEMSSLIISLTATDTYDPVSVHEDLRGDPFTIELGDVLAIGAKYFFIADPLFDPLQDSAASFIKIREKVDQGSTMAIDPAGEVLTITLSSAAYRAYEEARIFEPDVIHSAIVLPALAEILRQMADNNADYLDLPWSDRLQEMLAARNLNERPFLEAAEELLGDPILRSLVSLAEKQRNREFDELQGESL